MKHADHVGICEIEYMINFNCKGIQNTDTANVCINVIKHI